MQNVRTFPVSSTTTWLCTQVISGIVAKTRLDCRLTSGIWSSPTSNNRSTMYFGMWLPSYGQRVRTTGYARQSDSFKTLPIPLVEQGVECPRRVTQPLRQCLGEPSVQRRGQLRLGDLHLLDRRPAEPQDHACRLGHHVRRARSTQVQGDLPDHDARTHRAEAHPSPFRRRHLDP